MKDYKIFEDFFLGASFVLIATSGIMKVLGASIDLGITSIVPRNILALAILCLVLNIALNLQDLARK